MTSVNFRIFKQVPRLIYGKRSLLRLAEIAPEKKSQEDFFVFILDSFHQGSDIFSALEADERDLIYFYDSKKGEPKTIDVDALVGEIRLSKKSKQPLMIVGIGGGSAMDVAKGVSVMLCNDGITSDYQGWDLVKNRGIYKVGIPTIFGSGSEASRTAVFMGKEKKFGINSDFSMFDALLIDPNFQDSVPDSLGFYTGMDCYIHCVESLEGTMINEISKAYASKALELCSKNYMEERNSEQLATASYLGGVSIVNSEVGICHALSYGLSLELGLKHGYANCLAFNVLEEYYGEYVVQFRSMMKRNKISLPKNQCIHLTQNSIDRMVKMTLMMERPLTNALGTEWKNILTPDKIHQLYMEI